MTTDITYSLCGMCNTRCPIEVHSEGGQPRWLCGNRHTPSKQALCPRGAAGLGLYNDDERPLFPLIRTGARGEGKWRKTEWDEALDYIASRLKNIIATHGAQSILWSERPGPYADMSKAFLRGIGSPNYFTHDTSCSYNVNQASFSLTGHGRQSWIYDYAHCRHLVLQGRNVFSSLMVQEANTILNALGKGCVMTAIDVRPTITTSKAQTSLIIRPGTDYAFNLAIIHTLLKHNLYNKAFAETWIADLDALHNFVQPYTPDWAADTCDISAKAITSLVENIAQAAPAVIWHGGWMTSRYTQSFATSRSAYIINALLGSFESQVGLRLAATPKYLGKKGLNSLTSLYPQPKLPKADSEGKKLPPTAPGSNLLQRALTAAETESPYPIKAWFTLKHDPFTALPDPQRLKELIAHMELVVCLTFSWSDTAWFSDVVLPMPSYLERGSLLMGKNGPKPQLLMRRPAAPVIGNTRPDWQILAQLSERMGLEKLAFRSLEDIWDFQLQGTGIQRSDFDAKGIVTLTENPVYMDAPHFATPSGKIEFSPTSWKEQGDEALVPCQIPPRLKENTFRLITGRVIQHTQSHTQNNPILSACVPDNKALLAPERAQKLGLADGDTVQIQSEDGQSGTVQIHITAGIHPEALFLAHGFGHNIPPQTRNRQGLSNTKLLGDGLNRTDMTSDAIALQEHFVTVHKI